MIAQRLPLISKLTLSQSVLSLARVLSAVCFLFACSPPSPCPDQTELQGEIPPTSEAELAKVKYKSFEASCVVPGAHGKIRHGFYKTWYRGGKVLKGQYTYEGGIRNGDYSLFYPNGQLRETGKYRFGIKHGRWVSYHRNGNLHMEGEYQDGKKSGDFIVTSPSGTHVQKGPYFLDMKHGLWRSEYEAGNGRKIQLSAVYHYGQTTIEN